MAAVRQAKDIHNDSLRHPGCSVKLIKFFSEAAGIEPERLHKKVRTLAA